MKFFRPEIERTLKMLGVVVLVGLVILPIAWGYEQRRQARTWQAVACAYRMREVARRAPIVASADYGTDPCTVLQRLGFALDQPR